jgi:ATP-binding cassette subfamily B protein
VRAWFRGYGAVLALGFRSAPGATTVFLLLATAMALIAPLASLGAKLMVDAAAARDLREAIAAAALMVVLACVGVLIVFHYVDRVFTVIERASGAVDRRLMELVSGIPGLAHHERPEDLDRVELLRRARGDLARAANAMAGMVRVAVALVASALLLAQVEPILLLLPLIAAVSMLISRRAMALRTRAEEDSAEQERLRQHLFSVATSVDAAKEVRVFGIGPDLMRRHRRAADGVIRGLDRASWIGAALSAADGLLYGLAYAGAVALVLVRAIQGSASPGDVVLTVGLAAGLTSTVTTAVMYGTTLLRVGTMGTRLRWLEALADRERPVVAESGPLPSRMRRGIELTGVGFGYPGMNRGVLEDVDLLLPAGSVVALVGENGAGKTSLVKLLCGFYEPTQGRITVDGTDLAGVAPEAWRARVSATFQDYARFEFVLRESVGVGDLPRIEDGAAVDAALTRAGAGDVPDGLVAGREAQLGASWDDGVELSGGQWQKLALARGLMDESTLLAVLDEPTAALDPQTEHSLFERIAAAARDGESTGRVTLLVSHRFSTVGMADLIVVLERGRIREVGSHSQLMRNGGLYAELYRLQSRAYR